MKGLGMPRSAFAAKSAVPTPASASMSSLSLLTARGSSTAASTSASSAKTSAAGGSSTTSPTGLFAAGSIFAGNDRTKSIFGAGGGSAAVLPGKTESTGATSAQSSASKPAPSGGFVAFNGLGVATRNIDTRKTASNWAALKKSGGLADALASTRLDGRASVKGAKKKKGSRLRDERNAAARLLSRAGGLKKARAAAGADDKRARLNTAVRKAQKKRRNKGRAA